MSDHPIDPVLERPTEQVTVRGETITVGPLELRQIGPFTREIRYIVPGVMRALGAADMTDGSFELAALDLLADSAEQVQHALAAAIDRDPEWIGRATADEVIVLAQAVYRVNRDFFGRKVAPLLKDLRASSAAAAETMAEDGPTQSTT